MEKVVALALIATSVLFGALVVAPRFADGFLMSGAPVCAGSAAEDCLQEVEVVVGEREHGIRKDFGPIRWHLQPATSEELVMRTAWLTEDLDVGDRVTLLLWDGDPVAVRDGDERVESLAWGVNRWIVWGWAALALLLIGLTLLYHSLKPDPDDDAEPVDAATAATALALATAAAAAAMWAFFNAGGWFGVLVVVGVWGWLGVPLMIRGHRRGRRNRDDFRQARGPA